MLNLFILLLERVGLIILIAYILMNINHFKSMMNMRDSRRSQWQLIIIFGCFSMISNFTGIQIRGDEIINGTVYNHLDPDASLANTRVLTIGVSGLIGGPFVALAVALISGIYRVYIGGADAYIYLISSIVIALVSGYFGYKAMRANRYPTIVKGTLIGGTTEIIQMLCILIFSDNTEHAWTLVKLIAIPMISINSIGTAIFLSIILSTIKQEEETRAIQTHDVLQLANQTLPYFRSGLNEQSAKKAAEIILDLMRVSAVAITNRKDILTHVGAASDHHVAQKAIITNLSKRAIQTGTLKEAYSSEEIGCNHPGCPLEAAIVVPLRVKNDVVGTLKLYFTDKYDVNFSDKQLATGLAEIFSSQLELGQAETQSALIRDAEIKSLQAQVNPHFFFNAINTISALVRIDSEKARELLLQLSQFFRSNLQGARNNTISLEKELQQVESYLSLEQARYPDRFHVSFDIDDTCYGALVPPFAIQILVENAIKHAFKNRKYDNKIIVNAHKVHSGLVISVTDNGHGIPIEKLDKIGKTSVHSDSGTGSALENLNRRLDGLFGYEASLQIHSNQQGTIVSCTIPYHNSEEEKNLKAIIVDDEPLARNELNYLLNQIRQFEKIDEAANVSETLELLLYDDYDVIFLDINLMDESGLDLANKIKKMKHAPFIIFATAHDTFAVKAFELDAIDYILKPFEQQRIAQAVHKVELAIGQSNELHNDIYVTSSMRMRDRQEEKNSKVLPIEVDERIHIINLDDIIAISVNNGITTINSTVGAFETTEPLNHYEKKIETQNFMRIHRATLINKLHIQTIEHWFNYTYQLTMTNQLKFQVSRSYMKPFKQMMGLN